MVAKNTENWHGCPIRYGSAVFGDVWSLLILRDIILKGARYYADFLNAGEGISTNILATRLTKLEQEGILARTKDPDHGARVIYTMTEKGKDLVPILLEIIDWSEKWDAQTEVPAEYIAELRADRAALVKKTRAALGEIKPDRAT